MNDEFTTIAGRVRDELKVRGSRFIATAVPVARREEAEELVHGVRKEFHDATHHCYAYRVTPGGDQFRVQDDGEPSGSAGKPILAALDKFGLTDTLVVVTRYFGGTKLGVGGLVRAYGGAAEGVLGRAARVLRFVEEEVEASFPHERTGEVMHVISTEGARITETRYDEEVHLLLSIRRSSVERLRSALLAQTRGNINLRSR